MRASEVMIADPVVAAAGATSSEVAALMRVKNISVVPVVDNPKDRQYLGTISDRDIVARCLGAGHDPSNCSAADHARTDTPGVKPEGELGGDHNAQQARPERGNSQKQLDMKEKIDVLATKINGFLGELGQIGCEFKDFDKGLVDFHGRLDEREMLWCWKYGEERITFWHELEAGFSGRQPLPEVLSGA